MRQRWCRSANTRRFRCAGLMSLAQPGWVCSLSCVGGPPAFLLLVLPTGAELEYDGACESKSEPGLGQRNILGTLWVPRSLPGCSLPVSNPGDTGYPMSAQLGKHFKAFQDVTNVPLVPLSLQVSISTVWAGFKSS